MAYGNAPTRRVYPTCCTSAFCGGGGDDCQTCPNGPTLAAWNKWVEETGAICVDPIWSPLVYEVPSKENGYINDEGGDQ